MTDEDLVFTVRAPKDKAAHALKIASWLIDRLPSRKEKITRPCKERPFFIHADGYDVSVEYIPEEDIESLNNSLSVCGWSGGKADS